MGIALPEPNSSADVDALSFDLSDSFLFGVKRFDFLLLHVLNRHDESTIIMDKLDIRE